MDNLLEKEICGPTGKVDYFPSVSITLPFDPKMNSKSGLHKALQSAAGKVASLLAKNYSGETALSVMSRLTSINDNLDFSTHKTSIAIYLSPQLEKVFYLNLPLEEKIFVGEKFLIGDLLSCRKETNQCILLSLEPGECQLYLSDRNSFVKLLSNTIDSAKFYIEAQVKRHQEKDIPYQRQRLMEYIRYNDNVLGIILESYPAPVFVTGNPEAIQEFKAITTHAMSVIQYVPTNIQEALVHKLQDVIKPYIANWKQVKQKQLFNKLQNAAATNKLTIGVEQAHYQALHHKNCLLVVDKNYGTLHHAEPELFGVQDDANQSFSDSKIDALIEKVLDDGGEVEFADSEIVKDYGPVALIT